MTEQKTFGQQILDEIGNPNAIGVTDCMVFLSRQHGNHIAVVDDGVLNIFGDYDSAKEKYPDAINGYKRKKCDNSFDYWNLDDICSFVKYISDYYKINM